MIDVYTANTPNGVKIPIALEVTLPRFHIHQNVGNFLLYGGHDGKEPRIPLLRSKLFCVRATIERKFMAI